MFSVSSFSRGGFDVECPPGSIDEEEGRQLGRQGVPVEVTGPGNMWIVHIT